MDGPMRKRDLSTRPIAKRTARKLIPGAPNLWPRPTTKRTARRAMLGPWDYPMRKRDLLPRPTKTTARKAISAANRVDVPGPVHRPRTTDTIYIPMWRHDAPRARIRCNHAIGSQIPHAFVSSEAIYYEKKLVILPKKGRMVFVYNDMDEAYSSFLYPTFVNPADVCAHFIDKDTGLVYKISIHAIEDKMSLHHLNLNTGKWTKKQNVSIYNQVDYKLLPEAPQIHVIDGTAHILAYANGIASHYAFKFKSNKYNLRKLNNNIDCCRIETESNFSIPSIYCAVTEKLYAIFPDNTNYTMRELNMSKSNPKWTKCDLIQLPNDLQITQDDYRRMSLCICGSILFLFCAHFPLDFTPIIDLLTGEFFVGRKHLPEYFRFNTAKSFVSTGGRYAFFYSEQRESIELCKYRFNDRIDLLDLCVCKEEITHKRKALLAKGFEKQCNVYVPMYLTKLIVSYFIMCLTNDDIL